MRHVETEDSNTMVLYRGHCVFVDIKHTSIIEPGHKRRRRPIMLTRSTFTQKGGHLRVEVRGARDLLRPYNPNTDRVRNTKPASSSK